MAFVLITATLLMAGGVTRAFSYGNGMHINCGE